MKHYFHFKKGQSVPQWLMRVRDSDTMEQLNTAVFKVNGKVMLDDATGNATIWSASKRFSCVVEISGLGRSVRVDTDDKGSHNHLFLSDHHSTNCHKGKKISPLSLARRHGHDIYTTTKCQPLPAHFERLRG